MALCLLSSQVSAQYLVSCSFGCPSATPFPDLDSALSSTLDYPNVQLNLPISPVQHRLSIQGNNQTLSLSASVHVLAGAELEITAVTISMGVLRPEVEIYGQLTLGNCVIEDLMFLS